MAAPEPVSTSRIEAVLRRVVQEQPDLLRGRAVQAVLARLAETFGPDVRRYTLVDALHASGAWELLNHDFRPELPRRQRLREAYTTMITADPDLERELPAPRVRELLAERAGVRQVSARDLTYARQRHYSLLLQRQPAVYCQGCGKRLEGKPSRLGRWCSRLCWRVFGQTKQGKEHT